MASEYKTLEDIWNENRGSELLTNYPSVMLEVEE